MNPWKSIPVEDYDGHMNHPSVLQQTFLADFFERSIKESGAKEVLLAGCATGNGLERVDGKDINVVAMDINPEFVRETREKFGNCSSITIREGSVVEPIDGTFDLIFAGLVLEYVDVETALNRFHESLNESGKLAVVIQLESKELESITPTGFDSLNSISSIMKHLEPESLKGQAREAGFTKVLEEIVTLESGKRFVQFLFET